MAEYIERDKAVEKITAYCELRQAICINDKDEFLRGLQTALKAISYNDVIPNADVQPVKHGKWIKERRKCKGVFDLYQTYIHCSECGKEHYYGTGDMPNYCGNCGADMRGEDDA